jgi:small subunit ribosomal protein S19
MGNRSVWKGPFVDGHLLSKVEAALANNTKSKVIKTWSRRSVVLPNFVGLTFLLYNGKKFVPVMVTEEMVGRKMGEYAPTRTFSGHGANRKAKK